MATTHFVRVAQDLEVAGLLWQPEIGDEITDRERREMVSILVDPQGMTPTQLRETYLWLPTVEQIVTQLESRQAVLEHAGLEMSEAALGYKTVIQSSTGMIETSAETFRLSLALGLKEFLLAVDSRNYH